VQLGLIGLGKMGGNMAERLRRADHEVVGYDRSPGKRDVDSLEALVQALQAPRVVWVMVPAGEPTRSTVKELAGLLEPGDVIVDGGNSKYTDDQVHDVLCREKGIGYIDAGVSGGVWGLQNGYALMVGGSPEDVAKAQPVFDALKPPSIPDESGEHHEVDAGFVHAGPVGAGHFSKMVHNGIEYALMQAYGEGYELLTAVDLVEDVPGVIRSWTQGTVIRSWLLDLLVRALDEDPGLEKIRGYAEDSGEGRWTVEQAIENAVPMPTIAASLFARFSSRQDDSPTMKAVAALRNQFGGHAVQAVREGEAERPA
jgi:6-phosphogluconate dehydrogenase